MRIVHLILLGFTIIILLFALTTFINYQQSNQVRKNAAYVSMSGDIIRNSARYQRNILNMESGLRGLLLTGNTTHLSIYNRAAREMDSLALVITPLVSSDSVQKHLFNEIQGLHQQWIHFYSNPLEIARSLTHMAPDKQQEFLKHSKATLDKDNDYTDLQDKIREKFTDFNNNEYNKRALREKALYQSLQRTTTISLTLTIFSFIIAFIIVGFLVYRISTRISKLVSMANSIGEGHYDVQVEDTGKDELSLLGQSLNRMAILLSQNINLLKRKNDDLNQYAHIVSHDLKSPLRGIDNVITWIEEDHKDSLPDKVKDYLEIIKGRIRRSESLISGILSYARVNEDQHVKETVNTYDLVCDIVDMTEQKPDLTIIVDNKLPTVQTEAIPLTQVLSNLISNAIKYHNKLKGEIRIYSQDRGNHYEFYVQDNGPGIAKAYHSKVFLIFQTLQEKDSFESTGIGLSIVKKILEARNEKINIDSELGKGSTFSFTWSKN